MQAPTYGDYPSNFLQVLVGSRPRRLHHGSEVEPPAISPNIPDSAGVGNVSDHVAAQAFTRDRAAHSRGDSP